MIYLLCFLGGIVSFIIFAAIRLKLMKKVLQKPAICIHCKQLIPADDLNHWEHCSHHPAQQKVARLTQERDQLIKELKSSLTVQSEYKCHISESDVKDCLMDTPLEKFCILAEQLRSCGENKYSCPWGVRS